IRANADGEAGGKVGRWLPLKAGEHRLLTGEYGAAGQIEIWLDGMADKHGADGLLDVGRLEGRRSESGRAGTAENQVGGPPVSAGIAEPLDQQIVSGSKDVGGQPHVQCAVTDTQGVAMAGGPSQKSAGAEAIQISQSH